MKHKELRNQIEVLFLACVQNGLV